MKYTIERHNQHGDGRRPCRVLAMPAIDENYWGSVTDVPCPRDSCAGTVRWAEADNVPGYRICDACGRRFFAHGDAAAPRLVQEARR